MILVRWNLGDPSKPKGTAMSHEGTVRTSKIVFPDRSYDPRRLTADIWECTVTRDTMPDNPRRGAIIVRPLRELSYDWTAVGPELWGVREVKYQCVEYPGLEDGHTQSSSYEHFVERARRNAPWQAAVARQSLWTGSLWGHADEFFTAFGLPMATCPVTEVSRTGEAQARLVYPHGEKVVETRSLAAVWPFSATGQIRQVETVIEAEFRLDNAQENRFWDSVARLGGADTYSPPYTMTRFEAIDTTTQGRVLELLRASASAPENLARAYWEQQITGGYRGQDLETAWIELAALHAPIAKLFAERYLGQVHYAESDDGFRPAGSYTAWFIRHKLHVGGRSFTINDIPERETPRQLDVECERRRLIAEHWRQIREIVACRVPELTAHSEDISGMSEAEWNTRYHNTWTAMADEHHHDHATRAVAAVRSEQLTAEWEAFRAAPPQISLADDATELPPIAVQNIGQQWVYGVTSIEGLWTGQDSSVRTEWFREEAQAIAAHETAVATAAPVLERRVTEHLRAQIYGTWASTAWERLELGARELAVHSTTASPTELRALLTAIRAATVSAAEAASFERVTIAFGAPTRRQSAEGFWNHPRSVPGHEGVEIFLLAEDQGWRARNVGVRGAVGCVISVESSPGYHGGHVTVTVDVLPKTPSPISEDRPPETAKSATLADLQAKFKGRPDRTRSVR